jgi:hypothetical protein
MEKIQIPESFHVIFTVIKAVSISLIQLSSKDCNLEHCLDYAVFLRQLMS